MLRESILIVLYAMSRINIEWLRTELVKRGQFADWDVLVETILEMEKAGSVIRHNGVMGMREYSTNPEVVTTIRELYGKKKNAKFKLLDGRYTHSFEIIGDTLNQNEFIVHNLTTDMMVPLDADSVVVVVQ